MITAWLIYDKEGAERNRSFIDWFVFEANKQAIDLQLILRESLQIGVTKQQPSIFLDHQKITLPSIAIVRTIDPLLSKQLEIMGVHVFNNAHVASICNHKGLTHQWVSSLHIPMVDTYFYQHFHLTKEQPLPYPFVIKNVHGKGGQEVFFITSDEDWTHVQRKLDREIIIQSANVQLGKDLRVYVLGNEILAAVLRESHTGFKANFTLGGNAKLYELQSSEKAMIQQIISSLDFDFVGIDFLISKDGHLLFNEIEDVVGSRMLSELTNINVLEKYVTHILKKFTT